MTTYKIEATYEAEDGSRHAEDSSEALGDVRGRKYGARARAKAVAARLRREAQSMGWPWDYAVVVAE